MPIPRPQPGPVPKEAIDFLKAKGLRPAFSYLDVWREEHNLGFTVAKLLEKDLLADVQQSLVDSLQDGTPFEAWVAQVQSIFDRSGWSAYGTKEQTPSRLLTIYDTNMRMARSVGQWQRIERTRRTHPYLEYVLGPSRVHRPEHESWGGLVLRSDDPWWDTHMPPNGWGCKCGARQLSRREAEARGINTAPDDGVIEWEHPQRGTLIVPAGIDPGFDYNPGKLRAQKLREMAR